MCKSRTNGKFEPFSPAALILILGAFIPACLSFGILAVMAPYFGSSMNWRGLALVLFAPTAVIAVMALGQGFVRAARANRPGERTAELPAPSAASWLAGNIPNL